MEVRGFLSTKGMYQPLFRQYMTYQSKAVLQHSDQKAQNNNTVQGGWTGLHVLKIFLLVNFLLVGILSLLWNGVILDFLYLAYQLFFFFSFLRTRLLSHFQCHCVFSNESSRAISLFPFCTATTSKLSTAITLPVGAVQT